MEGFEALKRKSSLMKFPNGLQFITVQVLDWMKQSLQTVRPVEKPDHNARFNDPEICFD